MIYNNTDLVYYGTKAERVADTKLVAIDGNKIHELDTGREYVSDNNAWVPLNSFDIPEPNGGAALSVAAAGIVAITVPPDTRFIIITNPVPVRIAYSVTASATVGTYYPAYACPILPSKDACDNVSIYFTAACSGAYTQAWK